MDASSKNESADGKNCSIKPHDKMAKKPLTIYLLADSNLQNNENDSCKFPSCRY
jgi:uncharacterized Zn-finger protein